MSPLRHSIAALSLALACAASAHAQGQPAQPQPEQPLVTASATAGRVRFAAPNRVARLKLEVLSRSGDALAEISSKGSVLDWTPSDSQGNGLADGSYLGVLTLKDMSGRITQRLALIEVAGGAVKARAATAADLTAEQAEAVGPVAAEGAGVVGVGDVTAAALLAHDGETGQLVTTRGDLSFRGGDFFTGRDRELMRLSADGSLTVAGALNARGGVRFPDGTVLDSARGLGLATKGAPGTKGGGEAAASVAGTGTADRLAKWADGAGTLADSAVTETAGRVGIGTASPAQSLHVVGKGLFQNAGSAAVFIVDRTDGKIAAMGAGGTSSTFAYDQSGIFKIEANSRASIAQGVFGAATGAATRLTIDGAGNVGIGTETPQAKLHVAGGLRVTGDAVVDGNIAAKYQDVAEWVPGRGELPAGTVVVLDRSRVNGVMPSSRAYSTHVAGVVSAQPGVILGEGGPGQVMVATTGRVKVKVDASARPIRVGDLLVASDAEGVAMRSVPVRAGRTRLHRPGTIIGKALEPLGGGRGEILVLLSMQ